MTVMGIVTLLVGAALLIAQVAVLAHVLWDTAWAAMSPPSAPQSPNGWEARQGQPPLISGTHEVPGNHRHHDADRAEAAPP
jgi:hypothetical protein